jgi:site-specific DNA recombinase
MASASSRSAPSRHAKTTVIRGILTRRVYTRDAAVYTTCYTRRAKSGYARRPGADADVVVLRGVAPAIVTPDEQAAVLARLARNQAESTRNNQHPERTLLRAGFLRCGHCGRAMAVAHPPESRPGSTPQYHCVPDHKGGRCPVPWISAK